MHLVEHADLIARRVRLLDRKADLQLVRELMELHEVKCTHCQEDRLGCTVSPSCKNRNFLNMLIEVGVNPHDMPHFCYEQYLIQIRRFILEKKGRNMNNRRIPIKDILSILQMSSIRQFTTNFTKRWKQHARVREQNTLLLAGDDIFFHFDFTHGIVDINPWTMELRDFDLFGQYVRLFSKYYDVHVEIFDATMNWWILTIDLGTMEPATADLVIDTELQQEFDALHIITISNGLAIQAEIVIELGQEAVSVGALRRLFARVADARKS